MRLEAKFLTPIFTLASSCLSGALEAQPSFRETATFPLGANATSSALERLDSGRFHYWAGLGNGEIAGIPFEKGIPGTASRTPSELPGIASIALGDLNGDGQNDLVAVNFNPGNIAVLMRGAGGESRPAGLRDGLQSAVKYPLTGGPTAAAIVDWNADGRRDVVVTLSTANKIAILPNQGNGTLGPPVFVDCGKGPNAITPIDLDGSGRPGVATANFGDGTISVFSRGAAAVTETVAAGAGPARIISGDVNGDGWEDLICLNQTAGTVAVATASPGGGRFSGGATFPAGSLPKDLSFTNIDGGPGGDLVITNHTASGIGGLSIFSGTGTGIFNPGPRLFPELGPGGLVVSGDLDGDGAPDLVTATGQTGHVLSNEEEDDPCSVLDRDVSTIILEVPISYLVDGSDPVVGRWIHLPVDPQRCPPPALEYQGSVEPEFKSPFASFVTTAALLTLPPPLPPGPPDRDFIIYLRARLRSGDGQTSAWRAWALRVLARPAAFAALRFVLNFVTSTVPPQTQIGSVTFKNVGGQPGDLTIERNSEIFAIDPGPFRFEPGEEREFPIRSTDKLTPGVHEIIVTGTPLSGPPVILNSFFAYPSLELPLDCVFRSAKVEATRELSVLVTPRIVCAPEREGRRASLAISDPLFVAPRLLGPAPWLSSLTAKPDWKLDPVTFSAALEMKTVPAHYGQLQVPLEARFLCGDPAATLGCQGRVTLVPSLPVTSHGGQARPAAPVPLARPSGGTSLIVPSAVHATGLGGRTLFVSDGWLKNSWPEDIPVTLIYTPDSENGVSGPGVLRTERVLSKSSTTRLVDLVGGFFRTTGSGLVQIRSTTPQALSLRTVVEAETDGDARTRFGTEIPPAVYGSGIGRGEGELVLPGIDDDAANRANLILSETTGSEATVSITVHGPGGESIGETSRTVPPYGKIQVNGIVKSVAPSASLSGGWVGVTVTSGDGRVFAMATVIDNASSSFAAIRGRLPRVQMPSGVIPEALIIPGAARLPGAFNSVFTTSLSVANGTSAPAALTLAYHYVDADDGDARKSVTKEVQIPVRGSLPKETGLDVLSSLFGVTARSYGWIEIRGDIGRVVAMSAVSSLVDPADPSRGRKSAPVEGILSDSPDVATKAGQERRFAGAEKSPFVRTNLILVEVSGRPATASVRAVDEAGRTLASRTFEVESRQYLQINDIFGPNGLGLGDGPFSNVEIAVSVQGGDGRLISFVTRNDNISGNPEVFVLKEPGPPSGGRLD